MFVLDLNETEPLSYTAVLVVDGQCPRSVFVLVLVVVLRLGRWLSSFLSTPKVVLKKCHLRCRCCRCCDARCQTVRWLSTWLLLEKIPIIWFDSCVNMATLAWSNCWIVASHPERASCRSCHLQQGGKLKSTFFLSLILFWTTPPENQWLEDEISFWDGLLSRCELLDQLVNLVLGQSATEKRLRVFPPHSSTPTNWNVDFVKWTFLLNLSRQQKDLWF